MYIRFCISIVVIALAAIAPAQQYWIEQPCPTTKLLTRVEFSDSLNGWASGDSGVVIHTSNGGSWVVQQTNITSPIDDISFPTSSNGWALSNDFLFTGTILLSTTNGGLNWSSARFPDSSIVFRSVTFQNEMTGFIGGFYGSDRRSVVFKTTNGGTNWTKSITDTNLCTYFPILRINFLNSLTGFAGGGVFDQSGVFWRTTDGGLHWTDSCISAEPLFAVIPFSANLVIAAGGDFEYGAYNYISTDNGVSWRGTSLMIFGLPKQVARRTLNEFWIPCSDAGKFSVSIDTGSTWRVINAPDSGRIHDTKFIDQYHGWSVGCKGQNCAGSLYKYNTSVIGVDPIQTGIPKSTVLYQNYPNPFNPVTSIVFELVKTSHVKLVIYDANGKCVRYLTNEMFTAGKHTVNFDASNIASGLYFYVLSTLTEILSKKMVFLK